MLDKAKILSGKDIVINEQITLRQPTVEEVINFGEQRFLNVFYSFCSIPSDMKSVLWDLNIDFMKISDWELFISLTRGFSQEDTSLIFGEIDFSQMLPIQMDESTVVLSSPDGIVITEEIYLSFIDYVREIVGYVLKREKAVNKATKLAMIEDDRINRTHKKSGTDDSFVCTTIISLVNTEEFPYNYQSVLTITFYQLLKSFYQIQKKKSACALYQGSMSGFMDSSKIDKKAFNWIYTER